MHTVKNVVLATVLALVQALGWSFASADTVIRPIPNPIQGNWENVSYLKRGLPIAFHSIWFERNTASLIHIRIERNGEKVSPENIQAGRKTLDGSTSFFGEPKHPNVAQFIANWVFLQPPAYDKMVAPYFKRGVETAKSIETPYIWQLTEAPGNPHLFYHGQLTPRLVFVVSEGKAHFAEEYVPLTKTRNDFLKAGKSEAIVVEVQTKRDAIDAGVVRAGFPERLKTARFRYCVVLQAPNGFANRDRVVVSLATPLKSGIDCNTILAGFGFKKP